MKLLIGLGNPGEKYSYNRHNVGFMFCDFFAQELQKNYLNNEKPHNLFQLNNKFRAEVAEAKTAENKFIVAKPQTFMNLSGESVAKLKDFYKITPNDLIVAHDDLDIEFGKFKINKGNGPKMHNGLTSIEGKIGTKDFWRIRIGVDNRTGEYRIPGETYVLSNFLAEEAKNMQNIFKNIMNSQQFLQIFETRV